MATYIHVKFASTTLLLPLLVASGSIPFRPTNVLLAQDSPSKSTAQVASPTVKPSLTANPAHDFYFEEKPDRLSIMLAGQPIAEYVFSDESILRPYFTHLKTLSGIQVTRNHPPLAGIDAVDHDTMHPGLWLAFGDINSVDFWRNRANIQHIRYLESPNASEGRLTFATESQLVSPEQQRLGRLTQQFTLTGQLGAWLLRWNATFHADEQPLIFGDQEEMGCGVRVATMITEKSGGQITNSSEQTTAQHTWGQPAQWCDYSGEIDSHLVGVTLMAAPTNFRPCWWHNRDYGLMVANPFGRAAMKQGPVSQVRVEAGASLRLSFGACIHEGSSYDVQQTYREFVRLGDSIP